jgi:L-lactate dehydrogenase
MRVGIIGTGWVGASVAISTLHAGTVRELLLSDLNRDLAEGEAMDLAQGAPFYPTAAVRAAAVEEMAAEADAIVISAGRGQAGPGQSRLDLLRGNAEVARAIAAPLRGSKAVVIVLTNPVDVLTRIVTEASGLPPPRVIGTGTMLDTARLRERLARELRVDSRSVHAHVVGEHGDSEVVLWSCADAGGRPLRRWPDWRRDTEERIAAEVRRAAYEIIRRKGATNHAIGLVTASLLRSILRDERRVLTVSRVQEGALGLRDVALSLPTIVGAGGAETVIEPALDEAERAALDHSVDVLRRAWASL